MQNDPLTRKAIGDPPPDHKAALAGVTLPKLPYEIGERIGSGGTAAVHKVAIDGELWALKFPLTDDGRPSFRQEGLLHSSNSFHPNINPVHSFGTADNGIPYVISRLVDPSLNLAQFLTNSGLRGAKRFSFDAHQMTAFKLFAQLLGSADFLFSNRLLFRDYKSANVLVEQGPWSGESHARLTDFGLAEHCVSGRDHGPPRSGFAGTAPYLAPELFDVDSSGNYTMPYSRATDMYALGVVLHEVVAGCYPVLTRNEDRAAGERQVLQPERPSLLKSDVPVKLEAVCLKSISTSPTDRFMTPAEFLDALCEAVPARQREEIRSSAWISRISF